MSRKIEEKLYLCYFYAQILVVLILVFLFEINMMKKIVVFVLFGLIVNSVVFANDVSVEAYD